MVSRSSLQFRGPCGQPELCSGAVHTFSLGNWDICCSVWGFHGREADFLTLGSRSLLTQALKPSASAVSGTSPYPWPLQPILEVGHVVEGCLEVMVVVGGRVGSVLEEVAETDLVRARTCGDTR